MRHASPDQVAHVQQAVHPAEVDEDAVVGHVLHAPGHDRAFGKRRRQRLALRFLLFFQNRAAAHHHVAALAIQLQDADLDFAVLPRFQIVHRPQLDLRGRQKRAHADIHHQPALDPLGDLAGHVGVLAIRFLDALPDAAPVRAHVRQQHVAVFLLVQPLDFDRLSFAEFNRARRNPEIPAREPALRISRPRPRPRPLPSPPARGRRKFRLRAPRLGRGKLVEQLVHRFGGFGLARLSARASAAWSRFGGDRQALRRTPQPSTGASVRAAIVPPSRRLARVAQGRERRP